MAASRIEEQSGAQTRQEDADNTVEEEAGAHTANRAPYDMADGPNMQQISGLAFVAALQLYGEKDVAMAFAICLEAALYWTYLASPEERKNHANQMAGIEKAKREDLTHPAQQYMFSARDAGPPKTRNQTAAVSKGAKRKDVPSGSSQASKAKRGKGPSGSEKTASKPVKEETGTGSKSLKKAGSKDNQVDEQPNVFWVKHLEPGMVVLLRTEADEEGSWTKCWSLGRVLKISGTVRRSISVCWLKPVSGSNLPAHKIFAQKWVPWTFRQGRTVSEWTSSHLSLESIQYGAKAPKNGKFPSDVQKTLAQEVKRLEALVAEEEANQKAGKHSQKRA